MDSKSAEHFCVADIEFTEDLSTKHPGVDKGNSVTFGKQGFCLFSPIKMVNDIGEEMAGKKSGTKFIYRLSFVVPEEELEDSRKALGSVNPTGERDEHTPVLRSDYVAGPEALSYLQEKVNSGVRYIPRHPSPSDIAISPGTIPEVKRVLWSSTFRIRYCVADTFYKKLG